MLKGKIMRIIFFSLLSFVVGISGALAQNGDDGGETGLALPRFVSMRSNHINARSGPGARYPIEWVYMQEGMPVEIIAEFELWRKIKDWQGSESWVHKSMLNGKRMVRVVTPGENNLYDKPDFESGIIARVEDGVVGEVVKCPKGSDFCRVSFPRIEGWIPRRDLYGVYSHEILD